MWVKGELSLVYFTWTLCHYLISASCHQQNTVEHTDRENAIGIDLNRVKIMEFLPLWY